MIGNGSWATALVKMLTDNQHYVNWWIRNEKSIEHLKRRKHNPNYLPSAYFDTSLLNPQKEVKEVVANSDLLVLAVPSAYIEIFFQCIIGSGDYFFTTAQPTDNFNMKDILDTGGYYFSFHRSVCL